MATNTLPYQAAVLRDRLQPDQRQQMAFRLLRRLRSHNEALAYLFVWDAFLLTKLKGLIDHNPEVRRTLGITSFDAMIADPEYGFESHTKVSLQIQVIDLFWCYFGIGRTALYRVGYRKYQIITPELMLWRELVESGQTDLTHGRMAAYTWLANAQTLSVSALETAMLENSIAYSGERNQNRAAGEMTHSPGKWTVLRDSTPIQARVLLAMPRDELIEFMGLADISPDDKVVVQVIKPNKQ